VASARYNPLRKTDFDVVKAAIQDEGRSDLHHAQRVMEKNRHILQADGVVGMWVGARASKPYIMVAVMEHRGRQLQAVIPDSVDGVSVYYVEGTPTQASSAGL
jgi:hypothetical protein